jgi:hypothetical protein
LRWGAVALARGVAEKTAGTGVHRRGEHEARRKTDGDGGAGDGDATVLKGLTLLRSVVSAPNRNVRDLTVY